MDRVQNVKYWCNLASYWLQAVWGWHDSVETCSSVIICEIIVCICWFIVQNNKNTMVSLVSYIQKWNICKLLRCNPDVWCYNEHRNISKPATISSECERNKNGVWDDIVWRNFLNYPPNTGLRYHAWFWRRENHLVFLLALQPMYM